MFENKSTKSSLGKRLVVLTLTLGLTAVLIYMWFADVGDLKTAGYLAFGIVLGLTYTIRGGSLPESIYEISESHWIGGTGITTDDDPRNISPKVYLPILLAAILLAAALFYGVVRAKH